MCWPMWLRMLTTLDSQRGQIETRSPSDAASKLHASSETTAGMPVDLIVVSETKWTDNKWYAYHLGVGRGKWSPWKEWQSQVDGNAWTHNVVSKRTCIRTLIMRIAENNIMLHKHQLNPTKMNAPVSIWLIARLGCCTDFLSVVLLLFGSSCSALLASSMIC